MIENYKPNKCWYKCIAMLLTLILCVNLLAGCGKNTYKDNGTTVGKSGSDSTSIQNEENKTDGAADDATSEDNAGSNAESSKENTANNAPVGEKASDDAQSQEEDATVLLAVTLDQLEEEVQNGNMEEAALLTESLTEGLEQMSKEAAEITEPVGVREELSSEAKSLLEKRTNDFKMELSVKQKKAEELTKAIEESLSTGDTDKTIKLIGEARSFLGLAEETHTYGAELTNKAQIYTAEEAELCDTELCGAEISRLYTGNETGYPLNAANDQKSRIAYMLSNDKELTACTGITGLSEEMKALADELDTPLEIYNYIKNNIGYAYYYGSRKGASGTYESMNGNDVDQASLLIAMLRYKGYPAMYIKGNILLEPEMAMSLTGADTAEHAADVLASNGVPVTKLTSNGKTVFIKMEHVWVRTLVPYGNYRGAGNADGEPVWIDLDTGIKEYEAVNSIYDITDSKELPPRLDAAIAAGDSETFNSLYQETYTTCEASLSDVDLENTYVRKRIIKQKNERYLPLSLQYRLDSETETFAALPDSLRDKVAFEVDGFTLCEYRVDELSGKSILLSYEASTDTDAEILSSFGDLFATPSYAAYMTPVLYVDGVAVSDKDEEFLSKTLGFDSSFRIVFSTRDGKACIENTITAGSMYAVTLDVQYINDTEMESLYDEITALKDNVTKDTVYSPEYMGRYLEMTGKLYFAQVDLTYTMAADSYDVAVTRNLSEAITGYEVEKKYVYGTVKGIDFGGIFMDVDMDSHSVASLYGDEEAIREYLFTTGIMSSKYESGILEELTGEPAVSTISILETAVDNGIDILSIHSSNLEEGLSLLHTTDEVVSEIRSAVNSGHTVFIPREDVALGSWSGTGYLVLDRDGTGAYMISGGLNGGSTCEEVTYFAMLELGLTLVDIMEGLVCIFQAISVMKAAEAVSLLGVGQVALAGLCIGLSVWASVQTFKLFDAYIDGNEKAGEAIVKQTLFDVIFTVGLSVFSAVAKPVLRLMLKNKLIKTLGADVVEELLSSGAKLEELSKLVTNLKKLGFSDEFISKFAKSFGNDGLDWLRKARGLNISSDVIANLSKVDGFADKMDEILELIKKSSRSADEVAECIIKYGDEALDAIRKYGDDAVDAIIGHGDDAVEVIGKYGDDAVDRLKQGKTPGEIEKEFGGKPSGKYSEEEIQNILENIKGDGFKNNPLRQEYEKKVANLKEYGEELLTSGMSEKEVAQTLNQARRDLGIQYKDMTPQPLRDYIYEINMERYGDKLGPTYDWLVNEKGVTDMDIINSSSRPNSNIDELLSGFEEWLRRQ